AINGLRSENTYVQFPSGAADPAAHLIPLRDVGVRSLALVANHDGYYVWVAAYESEKHQWQVQNALKKHIAMIVGGDFASHERGPGIDATQSNAHPPNSLGATFTSYAQQHKGILTFFQLNTVLEGLFNLNLDPRVFFHNETSVEKEYALGKFFDQITAVFHPAKQPAQRGQRPIGYHELLNQETSEQQLAQEQSEEERANLTIAEFFDLYVQDPDQLTRKAGRATIRKFANLCLNRLACDHILDEFLVATEVISLKPIKGWIERCRRALIDELIEVTHRRVPLVQAQPPDGPVDRIEDVTEAQLRGYVMFLSAKLPLISNVLFHLQDLHYESVAAKRVRSHREEDDHTDPVPVSSAAYGPFHSWQGLLRAIQNDLQSLTDAINQARTDRMLYEQEQIHAEQETLAEIQRLNERGANARGSATSNFINIFSALLAFLGVILATGPLLKRGHLTISLDEFLAIINGDNIPGAEVLLFLIVIFLAIYFGAGRFFQWIGERFRRKERLEGKYYYEMDIHTDAPFLSNAIPELIEKGRPPSPEPKSTLNEAYPYFKLAATSRRGVLSFFSFLMSPLMRLMGHLRKPRVSDFKNAVRNSYRIERQEKSEALHKIYIEADIRVSSHRFMHAVLVYELLYHRPSSEHDYILKDLRVVSTHSNELTQNEITRLKLVLVFYFINPCLDVGWKLNLPTLANTTSVTGTTTGTTTEPTAASSSENQEFDAFFTITQTPAPISSQKSGQDQQNTSGSNTPPHETIAQ
ncbi:MAG TPA: hypothetical protein VKQ36_14365, partial [Ktedonobacterales bacterium]|nr:hypothetical protein [Ktedonobacterales bacterium]